MHGFIDFCAKRGRCEAECNRTTGPAGGVGSGGGRRNLRLGQGRPLGLLGHFISIECGGDRAAHKTQFLHTFTYLARAYARQGLAAVPGIDMLLEEERAVDSSLDDSGGEPYVIP